MAEPVATTRLTHRQWMRAVVFTALTVLLISIGFTEEFGLMTLLVLAAVFAGAGTFLWLFPGSRFFVLAFANSLAIYTCVYFFSGDRKFFNRPVMGVRDRLPVADF